MPDCDSPQTSSATIDMTIDSKTKAESQRRHLIDNIAFLVVRQHRRRQSDIDEPESKSVADVVEK